MRWVRSTKEFLRRTSPSQEHEAKRQWRWPWLPGTETLSRVSGSVSESTVSNSTNAMQYFKVLSVASSFEQSSVVVKSLCAAQKKLGHELSCAETRPRSAPEASWQRDGESEAHGHGHHADGYDAKGEGRRVKHTDTSKSRMVTTRRLTAL